MRSELLASFENIRDNNLMVLKEAKERGTKVVGIYCTYGPREPVLAIGAIPVGLCGTRQEPIAAAESELPANLCPLIKSSYGFAITDTCPYFHFSDLIIGETTCDGKKKMFELMQRFKPVHVMHLPQSPYRQAALELWYKEMVRLKETLEETFNSEITEPALREAIHVVNEGNRALKQLFDLNRRKPAVISGVELVKVAWQLGFHSDRWERVSMLERLVSELEYLAEHGYATGEPLAPRILLTGTPVGVGSEKVVALVEECGGIVVAMENCGGYKTVGLTIDEKDPRDPLWLLAEKYLRIPCAVMTPNWERLQLIKEMARDFQVDGVIDLTWQACHTYNVESFWIARTVKDELGLPYLHLETDYSDSDRESLRVRIEAFLEVVKAARMV
ncbi:MAG: 2-hydroxyacyl-CoA dehydratase [Syntrophothermus sp.]|uniref:double-cubane-cluster-containing anaerobic reductase n=1 Tax=Syntrophothermus sp. TaxID=2736299 RepID=UPI0025809675|nr:double-cubane-cluster-containing anaerobic reductase [Syntrophothermus sp.]NSW83295.1 2-hydroxyacyl-CoA dehydratase [Syntrophothermus sp.]